METDGAVCLHSAFIPSVFLRVFWKLMGTRKTEQFQSIRFYLYGPKSQITVSLNGVLQTLQMWHP